MDRENTLKQLLAYTDQLLARSSAESPAWNIEQVREGKPSKWNYIDACMITAVLALHDISGDGKYLRFADDFVGWFVNEDGSIKTYDPKEYNIDNIRPAKNLFALYELTGKEKYRKAMDTVHGQLDSMPRTNEGSFWHKNIYPWQVWLDGLYMAQPFYMQYEILYNSMRGCEDSFSQFTRVRDHLRDPRTGLYYHAYDESRSMYWANPETGCSENFWLRAIGWFFMALVDTLEIMGDKMDVQKATLQNMLLEMTDAILPWQDKSGMFYQIVNKPEEEGNYLETSGTMLVTNGILKAVRLGFLPEKYRAAAENAFYGTVERYLDIGSDGAFRLGGICLVAGLGGKERRDGSLEYYFGEPVVENDAKGVAPTILACTEMLRGRK